MTTRRAFIASILVTGAVPRSGWAAAGNPAFLAAAQEPDGGFALFGLTAGGTPAFRVPLAARGHAGAGHPLLAQAVAFARRPGTFALVIDCTTGRVIRTLAPPEDRQFNGHGVFARDGGLLFTVEQSRGTSDGVIGIWDVEGGYSRIGEMPSHGIGPHDLRLMPDGQTLIVANGGIATDPTDRTKLNLDTMQPNLAYIATDGTLIERIELAPDLRQNSIRHLAVRADGLVGFAMQWEGAEGTAPPLLGLHQRGGGPVLASAPMGEELAMQGYAGSIAFSGDGAEVAITSPRGGRIHRFGADGAFLGAVSRSDVCGLARHPRGFLASDGLGGLLLIEGGEAHIAARSDVAWDNHVVCLDSSNGPIG